MHWDASMLRRCPSIAWPFSFVGSGGHRDPRCPGVLGRWWCAPLELSNAIIELFGLQSNPQKKMPKIVFPACYRWNDRWTVLYISSFPTFRSYYGAYYGLLDWSNTDKCCANHVACAAGVLISAGNATWFLRSTIPTHSKRGLKSHSKVMSLSCLHIFWMDQNLYE